MYLTSVDRQQGTVENFHCYQCIDIEIVASDDIWSLDGNNKLTATRKNPDGTIVPVYCCLYGAQNNAVLTGNPSLPGCDYVVCTSLNFDFVIIANPRF